MIYFDKKLLYFIKLVLDYDNVYITLDESRLINEKFDELICLLEKVYSNQ